MAILLCLLRSTWKILHKTYDPTVGHTSLSLDFISLTLRQVIPIITLGVGFIAFSWSCRTMSVHLNDFKDFPTPFSPFIWHLLGGVEFRNRLASKAKIFQIMSLNLLNCKLEMHISRVFNFSSRNGKNGQFLVEKKPRNREKVYPIIPYLISRKRWRRAFFKNFNLIEDYFLTFDKY